MKTSDRSLSAIWTCMMLSQTHVNLLKLPSFYTTVFNPWKMFLQRKIHTTCKKTMYYAWCEAYTETLFYHSITNCPWLTFSIKKRLFDLIAHFAHKRQKSIYIIKAAQSLLKIQAWFSSCDTLKHMMIYDIKFLLPKSFSHIITCVNAPLKSILS